MRLVLADDHALFLEALCTALQARGHAVVDAVTTPEDFCAAVVTTQPDVALMDLSFPDTETTAVMDAVVKASGSTRVVILSASCEVGDVARAMDAGAVGFVRKELGMETILGTLDQVVAGETVVRGASVGVPRPPCRPTDDTRRLLSFLTPREREVLCYTVAGQDTVEIARAMQVAVSTVRTHTQHVLTKLGAHSRLEAAAYVVNAGLADELGPAQE